MQGPFIFGVYLSLKILFAEYPAQNPQLLFLSHGPSYIMGPGTGKDVYVYLLVYCYNQISDYIGRIQFKKDIHICDKWIVFERVVVLFILNFIKTVTSYAFCKLSYLISLTHSGLFPQHVLFSIRHFFRAQEIECIFLQVIGYYFLISL